MSGDELEARRTKLCRWIYGSATPFTVVENPHFRDFLTQLCPAFAPPTRNAVANKYLEAECTRLEKVVWQSLTRSRFCTVAIDAAEDQGKEHVYHVCGLTPRTHFIGTIRFGATTQSAKKIIDEMSPFLEDLDAHDVEVVGMMTDNEPKMVKLRETFQKQNDHMCIPGCGAHAGELVVRDIVEHPNVKPTVDAAKKVAIALKNTRLRSFLKLKLGVAKDHRIGVPLAS